MFAAIPTALSRDRIFFVARKNGKDPTEHLVELMQQQLAESRLHREQNEAGFAALRTGMSDLQTEVGAGLRDVRAEIRDLGDRITNIVDKTAPLVSHRPAIGRIVLYGWSEGVWNPAAVIAIDDDGALDLEVFGVAAADERRIVRRVSAGEDAGHWRWPDLH